MDVSRRLTCGWLFPRPALGISNSSTSISAGATTFAETREDLQWSDSRQWARDPGTGNATRRLERGQFPPPA